MSHISFSTGPLQVTLIPRVANMLGGNGILVNGPCLSRSDSIECVFEDGSPIPGQYVSDTLSLCVVPVISKPGMLPFRQVVTKSDGTSSTQSGSIVTCKIL